MKPKVGQRWMWESDSNKIIVEVKNVFVCKIIQIMKGTTYRINDEHYWTINNVIGWRYLEGQDKSDI